MTDAIDQAAPEETFAEFKDSFSYGSRTDNNFKFLKSLEADRAGQFFEELLSNLADSVDDGQVQRLTDLFYAYQTEAYAGPSQWAYEEGPFVELERPISDMRVALVTSSGHFVDGHDPQPFGMPNMSQKEATARISEFLSIAPTISAIPIDTPLENLRVRHGGYDIRTAQADPNVVFPVTRMKEMAEAGRIGSFAPTAYSFVGGCAQSPLTREAAPQWAKMLHMDNVEAVVLAPV